MVRRSEALSEGYRKEAEKAQVQLQQVTDAADARVAEALHQATTATQQVYKPQLGRLRSELKEVQVC